MPDAVDGLLPDRFRAYQFSVDCAIAFSLLHEIGHNDLGHFEPSRAETENKVLELEADSFAFRSLIAKKSFEVVSEMKEFAPSLVTGLLSAFMVFQIKRVLEQPRGLFDESHDGYPTIRARITQLMRLYGLWGKQTLGRNMKDNAALMSTLVSVSAFHPVFAYVIGTPWASSGRFMHSLELEL